MKMRSGWSALPGGDFQIGRHPAGPGPAGVLRIETDGAVSTLRRSSLTRGRWGWRVRPVAAFLTDSGRPDAALYETVSGRKLKSYEATYTGAGGKGEAGH